jgi:hypothetical protein
MTRGSDCGFVTPAAHPRLDVLGLAMSTSALVVCDSELAAQVLTATAIDCVVQRSALQHPA